MVPGSPFQAGGTARVLPVSGGCPGKVVIRVDNSDVLDKILFKIAGVASATDAGGYLMGGEAIVIELDSIPKNHPTPITVLDVVGDPLIYWSFA